MDKKRAGLKQSRSFLLSVQHLVCCFGERSACELLSAWRDGHGCISPQSRSMVSICHGVLSAGAFVRIKKTILRFVV